jgi:hypothetical protein
MSVSFPAVDIEPGTVGIREDDKGSHHLYIKSWEYVCACKASNVARYKLCYENVMRKQIARVDCIWTVRFES